MNSSEYLLRKRFNITNNQSRVLLNDSVIRQTKTLIDNGKEALTINSDLYNSKIKYYYTQTPNDINSLNSTGGVFPLLLYNSSTTCSITNLTNLYSISKINLYLEYLKNDEYDKVFTTLTTDITQEILYDLQLTKQNVDECYHDVLNVYEKIFRSIRLFYFLYSEIYGDKNNCEKYKEDSIILNDIEKLKKYLTELQFNLNEITVVSVKADNLIIKEEYIKYIQLYGVPYKSMFDEILLQQIKDSLNK